MDSNSENPLLNEERINKSGVKRKISHSWIIIFWPFYLIVGLIVLLINIFVDRSDFMWIYLSLFCVGSALGFSINRDKN